jgi:hypothetical protein
VAAVLALLDEEPAAGAAREVPRGDGLLARVELDGVAAVGMQVAEEAALPAREREERDRRRDADIDAAPDSVKIDVPLP